ncbi:hypothetical protein ID866_9197 [Astraeus odoratus]|nr:hypothetical protein ID866_9197 [Astraeus odoratus]
MAEPGPDPQNAVAPDFAAPEFDGQRQLLVDSGVPQEQALAILSNIWAANNAREQATWLQQVEAETLKAACLEDRKKNKAKYNPICNAPVPSGPIVIPCTMAQAKMRKGAYCELWYFTNQGLWAAEKAATSQEDLDYVAICQDNDDSRVLVVAASFELHTRKAGGKGESVLKLVADEELSWEDFMEATLHIVTAMKDNEWAEDCIEMFIKFWMAIHTHLWWHMDDPFSQKALLAYQEQQRWLWHLAAGTAHNWSLAEIHEQVLQYTKDAIITNAHKEELKALKECLHPTIPFGTPMSPCQTVHSPPSWILHAIHAMPPCWSPIPQL